MSGTSDGSVIPAVVIGAGPAGLTAAITLARHGIAVLLVERRAEGSELPRATVLSVGLHSAVVRIDSAREAVYIGDLVAIHRINP